MNQIIEKYLSGEISTGKACELMDVTRHIGEEILTDAYRRNEALKMAEYLIENCDVFQWKTSTEKPRWNFAEIANEVSVCITRREIPPKA